MKKLKPNQLGYWCSFCTTNKQRATHRTNHGFDTFACSQHLHLLQDETIDPYDKDHYQSSTYYLK